MRHKPYPTVAVFMYNNYELFVFVGLDKSGKFRFWLLSRYNDCCGRLFEWLSSENRNIKVYSDSFNLIQSSEC